MSIGIGVPNGIVNLPTVHMVQTFRGNYLMESTFAVATLAADKYFGTFFYAYNTLTNGQKVADANYDGGTKTGLHGSYDRVTTILTHPDLAELFPFDFDGVQGAIKAKGDEKWITFQGMYSNTITFTSTELDGYGPDDDLSATEKLRRNSRGTWRYQMNREAGMANSLPLSHIAGIDDVVSTIAYKYVTGGASSTFDNGGPHLTAQVEHKDGGFSAL